jgi:hypothetical protein
MKHLLIALMMLVGAAAMAGGCRAEADDDGASIKVGD